MYYIRGGTYHGIFDTFNRRRKKLAESYSKIHSISLEEAFKRALFEKIEDDFDLTVAEEAHDEYVKTGKKSRPIEKLWDDLVI